MPDFTGTDELASAEDLEAYALLFGMDPEIVGLSRKCSICGEAILVCDNGWLNAKPDPNDPTAMFGVMKMGPLYMMAGGAIEGGSMHSVHDHQPDDLPKGSK